MQISCIQRTERHIPIQPPALLTAEKANQTPSYFTGGKTAAEFVSSCNFFPQPHSWSHPTKILPLKAMTAALAALILIPFFLGCMRARDVRLFSTTGLLSYWGRLNTCFSEEKTV